MAFLTRLSPEEKKQMFTDVGWFMGLVPIYYREDKFLGAVIAERNWVPCWYFDLVQGIAQAVGRFQLWMDPHSEPVFVFYLTGEIE